MLALLSLVPLQGLLALAISTAYFIDRRERRYVVAVWAYPHLL